jgi:hypothetical protein
MNARIVRAMINNPMNPPTDPPITFPSCGEGVEPGVFEDG